MSNDRFDLVVYGGTPAGVIAAVAAARLGASVLVLEQTRHVGGLSTSGLVTAESEHMVLESFSGLALEFYRRLGAAYGRAEPLFYWDRTSPSRYLRTCSPRRERRSGSGSF